MNLMDLNINNKINNQINANETKENELIFIIKDSLFQENNLNVKIDDKEKILMDSLKQDSINIEMYRIIAYDKVETFVDTTISIKKEYKMNYLRRDYFELLPFANTGHAFNRLGYDFFERSVSPQMGARSKHYGYTERNEIKYYKVPTPLSDLFFKSTFEQGQLLDALVSVNTSPNFNYTIAYRGMRSLGKYINVRSNNSNFRLSFLVKDNSQRYNARIHYSSQAIVNQENGGITPGSLVSFEEGDPDFLDRSLMDNRFNNAESRLTGKRYHLNHFWKIIKDKSDLSSSKLDIGHEFNYETKSYRYNQNLSDVFFGESFSAGLIDDFSKLRKIENRFYVNIQNLYIGDFTASIALDKADYSFRSIYYSDSGVIPNKLKPNQVFLNAKWGKRISKFNLNIDLKKTIQSSWISDHFLAEILFNLKSKIVLSSSIGYRSQNPDFNFMLYQSDYKNYNWFNPDYENQKTSHLSFNVSHSSLGEISFLYQNIDNYTYYRASPSIYIEKELTKTELFLISQGFEVPIPLPDASFFVNPVQENKTINYLKIRYNGHYTIGKFALTNTFQYQNVNVGANEKTNNAVSKSLNVPEFILRSTISFTSDVFGKAMRLQTGITGQYFSEYYADRYNPLLGDFINQDEFLMGGFPRIDFFINAKVQQTRLFLKAEHLNSSLTGFNFYSAPNYPYRDFVVRFGIVWNFFM